MSNYIEHSEREEKIWKEFYQKETNNGEKELELGWLEKYVKYRENRLNEKPSQNENSGLFSKLYETIVNKFN